MKTNNAYKLPTYISNKALIQKQINLKLVEAVETKASNDDMSLKEKIVMQSLFIGLCMGLAYITVKHFCG